MAKNEAPVSEENKEGCGCGSHRDRGKVLKAAGLSVDTKMLNVNL